MKTFSLRPSKFLSIMMILGGALMLFALSEFPKPPDDFGDSVLTFMRISVIAVMIFGLVNLLLPKGVATGLIDSTALSKNESSTAKSFASLQHLYETGLLTHEEYRRKVDLLTRADSSAHLKK